MEKSRYEELSRIILESSIAVHREMGPGLLESVYVECLVKELSNRGAHVETNVSVPLRYKGEFLSKTYAMDILVEKEIVLELKSVEILLAVHEAQIISYLKLASKKMGFLINFNVPLVKNGFKRFVNGF